MRNPAKVIFPIALAIVLVALLSEHRRSTSPPIQPSALPESHGPFFGSASGFAVQGRFGGHLDSIDGEYDIDFEYAMENIESSEIDPHTIVTIIDKWITDRVIVRSRSKLQRIGYFSYRVEYDSAQTSGWIEYAVGPTLPSKMILVEGVLEERPRSRP